MLPSTKAVASVLILRNPVVDKKQPVTGSFAYSGAKVHCLEPSYTDPVHAGHPCIPPGTYPLGITRSEKFGKDMPEVMNVPGRTGVRIHIGNYAKDTEACILPGNGLDTKVPMVTDSEHAFNAFFSWLQETLKNTRVNIVIIQT